MKPNPLVVKFLLTIVVATIASRAGVLAGSWRSAPPIPTPRVGAVAGVIQGKLYVAGGATGRLEGNLWRPSYFPLVVATLEIYDPETETWSEGPPMPDGVVFAVGAVVDDKLYVFGGYTTDGNSFWNLAEYDPATRAWTERAAGEHGSALACSAASGATDIYQVCTSYVGVYDPTADVWTFHRRPESPESTPTHWMFDLRPARGGFVVEELADRLYAVGGVRLRSASRDVDGTLDIYDPASGAWLSGAPMPTGRYLPSAGVIDGKLLVAGGANDDADGLSTLEEYDPAIDAWTAGPDMPTPRLGAASGVLDGKLYVVGGLDRWSRSELLSALPAVEVYDPGDHSPEPKVCVCHHLPHDQAPPRRICIGPAAAQVHLQRHGDTLGSCGLN
jgi:Kelch motif/Galactose oxidase, central domain